jgi:hypothetical protein
MESGLGVFLQALKTIKRNTNKEGGRSEKFIFLYLGLFFSKVRIIFVIIPTLAG